MGHTRTAGRPQYVVPPFAERDRSGCTHSSGTGKENIVNKLISSTMVVGLLFAAASCSSDKAASTASTTATAADTAVSTAATTAGSTATSATGTLDEQALAVSVAGAQAAGVTLDEACLAGVIAQLSDADKQLIIDGGVGGTVTLSSAGEKLSPAAQACATAPTAAT